MTTLITFFLRQHAVYYNHYAGDKGKEILLNEVQSAHEAADKVPIFIS